MDLLLLVEAVGQRGRGRLVDDAQHFEAGDLAGVLGGLALGVVEVGGNGDDRFRDGLAELGLGRLLHLLQDEGGDLRRRILLALGLDPGVAVRALDDLVGDELLVLLHHRVVVAAADQALDGKQGVDRVGDALALGRQADEAFAVVGKGDDRGGGVGAFGVLENLGLAALHDGDARIGGAEVDPDDFAHTFLSSFLRQTVRTQRIGTRRPSKAPIDLLGKRSPRAAVVVLALYSGGSRGLQRAESQSSALFASKLLIVVQQHGRVCM